MNALDQSYKSAATDQDARCAMHVLDAECMRNRDYLRRHGYSSAQIEKMSWFNFGCDWFRAANRMDYELRDLACS